MHELIAAAAVLVLLVAYRQIYIFIAAWEVSLKSPSKTSPPSCPLSSSFFFFSPPRLRRTIHREGFSCATCTNAGFIARRLPGNSWRGLGKGSGDSERLLIFCRRSGCSESGETENTSDALLAIRIFYRMRGKSRLKVLDWVELCNESSFLLLQSLKFNCI